MDEKNINTLGLGVAILLTSLGIYFVGKSILNTIRAKAEDKLEDNLNAEIVQVGGGGSQTQATLEEQQAKLYNPTADVKLLRGYLEGYNVFVYPEEVNGILNKLTDAKLKKLASYYKGTTRISLYTQLAGEWYCIDGKSCYIDALKRLGNLNLR